MFDFCSVESAKPPEEFHGREAGVWEAESFVEAEVVDYNPAHPAVTVGRLQPPSVSSAASFVCLFAPLIMNTSDTH